MNNKDPRQVALQFNEYINCQDSQGLSSLMSEDHNFIDRANTTVVGKESIIKAWSSFFELFPEYRNTFEKVEASDNLVILYGYATWKTGDPLDYAIWTATIENNLVAEWRIYDDNPENKQHFGLSNGIE